MQLHPQALVKTLRWVVEYSSQPEATAVFGATCNTLAALAAADGGARSALQPGGSHEWGALWRVLLRGQPKRSAVLLRRSLDAVSVAVSGAAAGGGGGAAAAAGSSKPARDSAAVEAAEAAMQALLQVCFPLLRCGRICLQRRGRQGSV